LTKPSISCFKADPRRPPRADLAVPRYEKRNGKMQLPFGLDRSFKCSMVYGMVLRSVCGGFRGWGSTAKGRAAKREKEKYVASLLRVFFPFTKHLFVCTTWG